ncbi:MULTISPECIES: hypothetical protein [unclassified Nostoc]|uniref:hypothetical protein n=1 Tax=unclassified Nostoc TaxID=2593658 RepID=UPI002607CD0B|nr:hypothetical protein [Nostoc sp. S13]MDF5739717.1 hypothetical protein [Nostoc sp. S13]
MSEKLRRSGGGTLRDRQNLKQGGNTNSGCIFSLANVPKVIDKGKENECRDVAVLRLYKGLRQGIINLYQMSRIQLIICVQEWRSLIKMTCIEQSNARYYF